MPKKNDFQNLIKKIKTCNKCPGMEDKTAVLGEKNGDINSDLLFLGEAPGRLGCDRTRIPFHGDQSGDNFEELMESIKISRDEIFITNCVLCNPVNQKNNNRTPNKNEMRNCSHFLEKQLNLVDPKLIATIGATALKSLKYIKNHNYQLKNNCGELLEWDGYKLIPLYHTSPRARIHRSKEKQKEDWKKLKSTSEKLDAL